MSSHLRTELKRSKYRILGLVGQGQFGQVFCAVHRQTGRLVALKNLEHKRFSTHKFLRELRFLLSLHHPNIVSCQALEHTQTGRYLVMDYCEGGTLRDLLGDSRLSLPQSLKLVADILTSLEHAHSRGIVHCDIKPENILLSLQPRGWTAKISDFGIARLSQEFSRKESGHSGSPAYMAPERFYGQYSHASDLYSVGILLFELITGHRPFSGNPAELMSAHLNRSLKLPDTVPEVWHPFLAIALQKLSARRFRSATEMLTTLKAVSATEGSNPWLVQSAYIPLLLPNMAPSVCLFESQQQQPLEQPITDLSVLKQTLYPQGCLAAVEAEGRWLATATTDPGTSTLTFGRLPGKKSPVQLCPQPIQLFAGNQSFQLIQLIALDSRHVAAVGVSSARSNLSEDRDSCTSIEIFTRRGDRLGCLTLPLQIERILSTPTPYRLIATDQCDPGSVLFIDLKPFKVLRFGVEIAPQLLAAAEWGYLLADAQGQIVLLDRHGQQVSRIEGPANPTAIAPLGPHSLLVATWDGTQGYLHTADLKQLGVDFIF